MVQLVISTKKTENEIFKIISQENFLKYFVNRDTNKVFNLRA